jgi:hypothetical protein
MTLYTSLSDWIPQPGRITRSWSSGLVLLQQEFIGSISENGLVAVDGDAFPGDDAGTGAKVYGIPEYRDLGTGMQSAIVSAYGIVPGKSGVETLTELSFSVSTMLFTAVKKNPLASPPFNSIDIARAFSVLITNKKIAKPFLKPSPSTISTPANDGEFKILGIGPIGTIAAGASIKDATFTVSQMFPEITSAWSGNHSPLALTSSIGFAQGNYYEYRNFGAVIESSATFSIFPNPIDFGEFQVPENP